MKLLILESYIVHTMVVQPGQILLRVASKRNGLYKNADYNPDWVSLMPISNGLRLSYPGVEKSDNLGDSWSSHMLPDNATATHTR